MNLLQEKKSFLSLALLCTIGITSVVSAHADVKMKVIATVMAKVNQKAKTKYCDLRALMMDLDHSPDKELREIAAFFKKASSLTLAKMWLGMNQNNICDKIKRHFGAHVTPQELDELGTYMRSYLC